MKYKAKPMQFELYVNDGTNWYLHGVYNSLADARTIQATLFGEVETFVAPKGKLENNEPEAFGY